jgi:hypothetical protein
MARQRMAAAGIWVLIFATFLIFDTCPDLP